MLFGGGVGQEAAVLNITRAEAMKLERGPRCVLTVSFKKICLTCDFTCLRRDLKGPSDALVGEALAHNCKDLALPCCEYRPTPLACLPGTVTAVAGVPL
jgi:hypothetical protein